MFNPATKRRDLSHSARISWPLAGYMLFRLFSACCEIWQRSSDRWDFHGADFGAGLQSGGGGPTWRPGIERDRTSSHAELSR